MFRYFETVAKACALLAGVVMTAIMGVTLYSVIGRTLFDSALLGDFELVQVMMAIGVAWFLPMCQLQSGNIIVDFFTTRAQPQTRDRLDRFGALTIGMMMGILTWRTALGGLEAFESGTASMMIQVPEWYGYFAMVPPLAITTLTAFAQATFGHRLQGAQA